MRAFIETQIKAAANSIGIEHVAEKTATPANLSMPKPRLDYEFMPDSLSPTGRKLSKRTGDLYVIRHERYEVDTPVTLYLTDNDDARLEQLTKALIMAFPKGVADLQNNWLRIRASTAEWSKSDATKAGERTISPMHERSCTIRMNFLWRLTYDEATPYLTRLELKLEGEQAP